jgi:hypothetical protein
MERELQFPRLLDFGRDYWLCRCQGFRVRSRGKQLGIVEEVRYRSRLDRPDSVVVRGGLFGTRRLVIPVAAVEEIVPRQQQLVVRPAGADEGRGRGESRWPPLKRSHAAASS